MKKISYFAAPIDERFPQCGFGVFYVGPYSTRGHCALKQFDTASEAVRYADEMAEKWNSLAECQRMGCEAISAGLRDSRP